MHHNSTRCRSCLWLNCCLIRQLYSNNSTTRLQWSTLQCGGRLLLPSSGGHDCVQHLAGTPLFKYQANCPLKSSRKVQKQQTDRHLHTYTCTLHVPSEMDAALFKLKMDSSIHLLDRPRAPKPTEIVIITTQSSLPGLIYVAIWNS